MTDQQPPDWYVAVAERARNEAPSLPQATVQAIKYLVSCIPEGADARSSLTLSVEYRGDDLWAVMDYPHCLSADGTWDFEHTPSERTDEWIATHRFDLDTALTLARQHAPLLHVNGFTVSDVLAVEKKRADRHG